MYIDNMLSQQNSPRLNMELSLNKRKKRPNTPAHTQKNMEKINRKKANKQTKITTEESRGTIDNTNICCAAIR